MDLEQYPAHIESSYLYNALSPERLLFVVKRLAKQLFPFKDDFDTIVFTGTSGLLVGPLLVCKMKKQMLVVRKENDNSHSSRLTEGHSLIQNYIIVDDLVSTGRTIKRIIDSVKKNHEFAKLVGIALYNSTAYWDDQAKMSARRNGMAFIVSAKSNKTYSDRWLAF